MRKIYKFLLYCFKHGVTKVKIKTSQFQLRVYKCSGKFKATLKKAGELIQVENYKLKVLLYEIGNI